MAFSSKSWEIGNARLLLAEPSAACFECHKPKAALQFPRSGMVFRPGAAWFASQPRSLGSPHPTTHLGAQLALAGAGPCLAQGFRVGWCSSGVPQPRLLCRPVSAARLAQHWRSPRGRGGPWACRGHRFHKCLTLPRSVACHFGEFCLEIVPRCPVWPAAGTSCCFLMALSAHALRGMRWHLLRATCPWALT